MTCIFLVRHICEPKLARHHLQKCQSHLVDLSTDLVCVPCWGNAAWSRRHGRDPKRVTASRANGRPAIRSARLHWESHVFKRVRQGALALAVLAPAGSTVTARGTTVLLVAELLAVLVIISVVWAAIWSSHRSGARTHWRSWTACCDGRDAYLSRTSGTGILPAASRRVGRARPHARREAGGRGGAKRRRLDPVRHNSAAQR